LVICQFGNLLTIAFDTAVGIFTLVYFSAVLRSFPLLS